MKNIATILLSSGGKCLVIKMNWLSPAHLYGQSVEIVWTETRWDVVEKGEGSNTAITIQLISIGVTERISVTPSMFTQPSKESSSEKDEDRREGKSKSLFRPFIHSDVFWDSLLYIFLCIHILSLMICNNANHSLHVFKRSFTPKI